MIIEPYGMGYTFHTNCKLLLNAESSSGSDSLSHTVVLPILLKIFGSSFNSGDGAALFVLYCDVQSLPFLCPVRSIETKGTVSPHLT